MSLELLNVPKCPWRGHLIVQNLPSPPSSTEAFFSAGVHKQLTLTAAAFIILLFMDHLGFGWKKWGAG